MYNQTSDMIQVTKKDAKEPAENLIRRFTRRVQQSGVLAQAKSEQHFEKEPSKRQRRERAIDRNRRRAEKFKKIRLGR